MAGRVMKFFAPGFYTKKRQKTAGGKKLLARKRTANEIENELLIGGVELNPGPISVNNPRNLYWALIASIAGGEPWSLEDGSYVLYKKHFMEVFQEKLSGMRFADKIKFRPTAQDMELYELTLNEVGSVAETISTLSDRI